MAKKAKEEPVPTINSVQNRDIIQRLNYMYQAGAFLQSLHAQTSSSSSSVLDHRSSERAASKKKGKKAFHAKRTGGRVEPLKTMGDLGRSYVRSMKVVGQRTTVKMDPSIKRTICEGCDVALVPGMTVSTRVEKLTSHGHAMVYTCLNCDAKRRIPAPPVSSRLPPLLATAFAEPKLEAQPQIGNMAMEVNISKEQEAPKRVRGSPTVRKNRVPRPHQSLLAARKGAGHVIFRGSTKVIDEDDP